MNRSTKYTYTYLGIIYHICVQHVRVCLRRRARPHERLGPRLLTSLAGSHADEERVRDGADAARSGEGFAADFASVCLAAIAAGGALQQWRRDPVSVDSQERALAAQSNRSGTAHSTGKGIRWEK